MGSNLFLTIVPLTLHLVIWSSIDFRGKRKSKDSTGRFNHVINVLQHFSKRLNEVYLLELREHHLVKYHTSDIERNAIDVVLIYDEHLPQTLYKTDVVESFFESSNGKNELQISDNILNEKTKCTSRPINKLYRVEASESSESVVRVIDEKNIEVISS